MYIDIEIKLVDKMNVVHHHRWSELIIIMITKKD